MRAALALVLVLVPWCAWADTSATFLLPSGVKVTITEAAFNRRAFKVAGCGDNDTSCRINGRLPIGVAFGLPKTYVKSIVVSHAGHIYLLDAAGMYDAWGNRPLEVKGVVRYFGGKCSEVGFCQFRGLFSDGAGTFVAEWSVVGGISTRTVLTASDDVVNLFRRNIDPPEFKD